MSPNTIALLELLTNGVALASQAVAQLTATAATLNAAAAEGRDISDDEVDAHRATAVAANAALAKAP